MWKTDSQLEIEKGLSIVYNSTDFGEFSKGILIINVLLAFSVLKGNKLNTRCEIKTHRRLKRHRGTQKNSRGFWNPFRTYHWLADGCRQCYLQMNLQVSKSPSNMFAKATFRFQIETPKAVTIEVFPINETESNWILTGYVSSRDCVRMKIYEQRSMLKGFGEWFGDFGVQTLDSQLDFFTPFLTCFWTWKIAFASWSACTKECFQFWIKNQGGQPRPINECQLSKCSNRRSPEDSSIECKLVRRRFVAELTKNFDVNTCISGYHYILTAWWLPQF